MNETEHPIFLQFPEWNSHEWHERLKKELKGDSEKALSIELEPGLICSAFPYDTPTASENGFSPPYRRGAMKQNHASKIRVPIIDNATTLNALEGGANSLAVYSENALSYAELETLLKGVYPEMVEINFSSNQPIETFDNFSEWIKKKGKDNVEISGAIESDPLHNFLNDKTSPSQIDYEFFSTLHKSLQSHSSFRCIEVNATVYNECALPITWELAFTLAHGHEHIKNSEIINIDELAGRLQFRIAHTTDFLMEICKLRAFRILWSNIISAHQPLHNCSHLPYVLSVPNTITTPASTPETNILRLTTIAMGAMLGGCDSLELSMPELFDQEMTQRICRNISLILQEESFVQKVIDPVGGARYMENLCDKICEKAWENFQAIEKAGGLIAFIETKESKDIMNKFAEDYASKINGGVKTKIGVNKYQKDNVIPIRLFVDRKSGRIPKLYWKHG